MSSISSIGFTAGGIDVAQIVSGLMQVERQPITRLQTKQSAVKLQSDAVGRLRTNLENFKALASGMLTSGVAKLSSNVSIPSAATATLSAAAAPGSVTFTVDQLARAQGMRSGVGVGASTSVITTAALLAVSTTTGSLGLGNVAVGAGVTAGNYTVSITQATVGATHTATTVLAGSTVIGAANNTINVDIDGVATAVTIAAGTYTASGLVTAIQTAIDGAGGGMKASLDVAGRLKLATTHEGSTATLAVTGGNALASVGLAVAGPVTGTDGIVKIGANPPVTVTSAGTGGTVAVSTGTGNLTLDVTGGLRVGDSTVAVVSTGDKSLAAVAAAINGANVGATAAAVNTGTNVGWYLQVNAASTGTKNKLALDPAVFGSVGGLVETSAAQDAKITIGNGPGAYSVTASGNTFTNVLPGVTITATAESVTPVTVSVTRNESATADAVDKFVTAANSLLADINLQTKYDAVKKTASPLTGNMMIRRLADEVRAAINSIVDGTGINLASQIGITTQKDGTLKFDRTAFAQSFATNPAAVERLFARGGSSTGGVTFAAADDKTLAGTYAVNVTTAATRSTTGDILVGGSVAGQLIGVRIGAVTATYQAPPGATPAEIALGLNAAMAAAGLKVNAEESGGGVKLTAVGYGAGGSFETNLDISGAGVWAANTGTDVAGTIDGVAAIGVGQRLRLLNTDTSDARGLAVDVGEGLTGALGPVTYSPGIAGRIVSLATSATGEGGILTSTKNSFESRITAYTEQIDRYEARMVVKETQLRRQWTSVQTLLSTLQTQGNWLAGQVNSLNGGNN
jgi:flagellar hook-associated protein 2